MNKFNLFIVVISISLQFVLTGCSSIFSGSYGIKKTKKLDEKIINRYAKKFNIPNTDNYELDTAFTSFLFIQDTSIYTQQQLNNHFQPLQALYFDISGSLKSYQVNCYAGGFPNLNWNRQGIFNEFIPKQQAPIDSLLTLTTQLNFLKPLSKSYLISTESYDYVIVVYWSRFMGRQSKRFIRIIQKNIQLEKTKKVKIIYANNDNIFAK
jgi:hypothetical protein